MIREIKKGQSFYPFVETGGYGDADDLSVKIIETGSGNEVANEKAGTFTNVTKPIESHEGDVDGAQSAGTLTITMKSGNTLVEGDLVIIDDVYYRLSAGDDTSITLQSELVKDVAADTNIKNSSYTSTYKGDVQIADAVGLVDVIISHPEMDDTILKYNIVNDTLAEKIDKVGTGARRMVASA
jgi:hypothetical protein